MIIVKIDAGMGNQMLEYCFYKQLTDELQNCTVKADMDRWIYKKYAPHNGFELDKVFGISFDKVATTKEILSCGGEYQRKRQGLWDALKKKYYNDIRVMPNDKIVRMHQEEWYDFYDKHHDNINEYNCWIDNAWCRVYEPAVSDFVYVNELKGRNREISGKMKECNSVAVHIRVAGALGNALEDGYFISAIRYMKEKLDSPVFFFFSNAPEQIRDKFSELDIDGEIIDWNKGADSHYDMQLMSSCKHNVICYSSFSLWGAILNANPDKTVIKPDLLPDILVPESGKWYSADNSGHNMRFIDTASA